MVRRPIGSGRREFETRYLRGAFSMPSYASDLSTAVATLPGAWRFRVSAGWPGVSILWLGEIASLQVWFATSGF